jgi:hypothetical protein
MVGRQFFLSSLLVGASLMSASLAHAKDTDNNVWGNWNLIIVQLDNSGVPMSQFPVSLRKSSTISKDRAPKITIDSLETSDQDQGRVIDIVCDNTSIKQKFYSVSQLKGWASKMTCYGQSYYFIVNPVGAKK